MSRLEQAALFRQDEESRGVDARPAGRWVARAAATADRHDERRDGERADRQQEQDEEDAT